MSKFGKYIMVITIFCASCIGENPKESDVSATQIEELNENVWREITKVVTDFNNAMVNADSVQLEKLTSDALTYGHSSGLVQNKSEFIDDVIHGPFDFSKIDNPEQSIHLLDDTAIIRHVFEAKATNDGNQVDIRIGNIQVYKKNQNGIWKLLARQAYKLQ